MGDIFGSIGGQLVEWVLPAILATIGGLVTAAIARFLKQQGLELTASQEARLRQIVQDAIQAIEERARREPMTSHEKAAAALELVAARAPEFSAADITAAIDAARPSQQPKPVPSTPATLGRGEVR